MHDYIPTIIPHCHIHNPITNNTIDTAGAVNLISAGWTAEGFFTDGIDTACQGDEGVVYFFCKDEFITYDIAGPLPDNHSIDYLNINNNEGETNGWKLD